MWGRALINLSRKVRESQIDSKLRRLLSIWSRTGSHVESTSFEIQQQNQDSSGDDSSRNRDSYRNTDTEKSQTWMALDNLDTSPRTRH